MRESKRLLTRRNDHSLPDSDVPQDRPHVAFHLGINSSAEFIDEQIRGVSCTSRKA